MILLLLFRRIKIVHSVSFSAKLNAFAFQMIKFLLQGPLWLKVAISAIVLLLLFRLIEKWEFKTEINFLFAFQIKKTLCFKVHFD